MDFEQRSKLLRRINNGILFGKVDFEGNLIPATIIDPKLSLLAEADIVYDERYEFVKDEAFTLNESFEILKERGQWSSKLEKELKSAQDLADNLGKTLSSLKFKKKQQKTTVKTIESLKNRIDELTNIKNQLWPHTAEAIALRAKRHFLIQKSTKLPEEYLNLMNNIRFLDTLSVYYFEERGISAKEIRELARTEPWRLYWIVSKETGTSLFGHASVEMTEYQYVLAMWTNVYSFAYSSNNCPTDDVLDDDERFDAWYKNEVDKINRDRKVNQLDGNFSGQETFVPADIEGAKEVYDLNDPMERKRIRDRFKFIEEKDGKEIKEADLPDVKRELIMQANRLQSESTMNRSK